MARRPSFEWLISPTSPQEFFDQHWEAEVLVQRRGTARYHSELLSLQAVDDVISRHQLRHPDFEVFEAGEEILTSDYAATSGTIDVNRVFALFSGGATIRLGHLERQEPALAKLCTTLGAELSIPFQANVYLTPANGAGFPVHYDTHDVFILQIEGTKSWTIFGSGPELPLPGQVHMLSAKTPGPMVQEFDLAPGDLAYLPRGTWHRAQSGPQASLHITLGAIAHTWTDLMLEAVAVASISDVSLRRSLPIGFARPGFKTTDYEHLLKRLVRKFAENVNLDEALSGFRSARFDYSDQPSLGGRLVLAAHLDTGTPDRALRMRRNISVETHDVDEGISIEFLNRKVLLPRAAKEIVQFMVNNKEFRASELPGGLDMESRMAVIRRMVLEGLLEPA